MEAIEAGLRRQLKDLKDEIKAEGKAKHKPGNSSERRKGKQFGPIYRRELPLDSPFLSVVAGALRHFRY